MPTLPPIVGNLNLKPQDPAAPAPKSVPKPVAEIPQFGMWIGFLYIVSFISLYIWATSFGNIVHEIVNRYITDSLELEEARRSFLSFAGREFIIKWSLAALAVFYPFFVLAHLLTTHYVISRPVTVNIRVRKILIYITLIGTFLVSCYQLAKFVNSYLMGVITFKTFVHFIVTLTLASLIFVYYFFQIRRDKDSA